MADASAERPGCEGNDRAMSSVAAVDSTEVIMEDDARYRRGCVKGFPLLVDTNHRGAINGKELVLRIANPVAGFCLLLLLFLLPRVGLEAAPPRIVTLDAPDPWTKRAHLLDALKKAGFAGRAHRAGARLELSKADVLVIGSLSTSDAKVRKTLADSRQELDRFLTRGGVILQFAQDHRHEADVAWLPEGLSARRGGGDGLELKVDRGKAPLWDVPTSLNPGALAQCEALKDRGGYHTGWVGTMDLFVAAEGFAVLATGGGSPPRPAVLAGRHGQGLVLLVAMPADDAAAMGGNATQEAEARAFLGNLLVWAGQHRTRPMELEPGSFRIRHERHRVTVYVDHNGNFRQDAGEGGFQGATVHFGLREATTGAGGTVEFEMPGDGNERISLRIPRGYGASGPWSALSFDGTQHSFGIRPTGGPAASGGTLWQVTDVHIGLKDVKREVALLHGTLSDIRKRMQPGDLVVFTGDVTHRGTPEQLKGFVGVLREVDSLAVSVPGNHDEGVGSDKGRLYRLMVGPDLYTREWGGYLLVVIKRPVDSDVEGQWMERQIREFPGRGIILTHYLPRRSVLDRFPEGKIAAVISGHWHGDQVVRYRGTWSVNSPASLVGNWDFSPAGARAVSFDDTGLTSAAFLPRVVKPASVAQVSRAGEVLVAHVSSDPSQAPSCDVAGDTVFLEGVTPFLYRGDLPKGTSEGLSCRIVGGADKGPGGSSTPDALAGVSGNHTGRSIPRVRSDVSWATALPGRVHLASPVLAGDRVLVPLRGVPVPDTNGAVYALSVATGEVLWQTLLETHPAVSPVVVGGIAVVVQSHGRVSGIRVADGTHSWSFLLDELVQPEFVAHYVHSPGVEHRGNVYYCYQNVAFGVRASDGKVVFQSEKFGNADAFNSGRGVVVDGKLYCAAFSGRLHSFDIQSGSGRGSVIRKGGRTVSGLVAQGKGLWILEPRSLDRIDLQTGKGAFAGKIPWSLTPTSPVMGEGWALLPSGDSGVELYSLDRWTSRERIVMKVGTLVFGLDKFESATPVGEAVLHRDRVLVPGVDGVLRRVGNDGSVEILGEFGVPLTSAPAVGRGFVIVADWSGMVYRLD
jgi:outer membrane protein assembly factor BamB/predicted phosphodiesterase